MVAVRQESSCLSLSPLHAEPECNKQRVLEEASHMLREKYGFSHTTLQVEEFHEAMVDCGACQGTQKKS